MEPISSQVFLGLVAGFACTTVYEFMHRLISKLRGKETIIRIKGYHLHHSIPGLMFVVFNLKDFNPFWLGIGLGIILRHLYSEDNFRFVDKT